MEYACGHILRDIQFTVNFLFSWTGAENLQYKKLESKVLIEVITGIRIFSLN